MAGRRRRLDRVLVERGLADSRTQAQALIKAGKVLVAGIVRDRPAAQVDPGLDVKVTAPVEPFVSRGGRKLDHALQAFGVDPSGRTCADLGASTGGFTDCLLQRGAARVYAIDVGYGQLAWTLRSDARVVVMERTNARHLEALPEAPSLLVGDLSFISLRLILPAVLRIAAPGAEAVLLIKPQFEAGRDGLASGGRVKSPEVRAAAIARVLDDARALGCTVHGTVESSVPGAKSGNIEELVHLGLPDKQP
jgi:23S rRNA (cytidine1920-2'-O)/16S rRNA (cytidine1409-2'-O)-methyltransferase